MLKHIPFYGCLMGQDLADGKKATSSHVLVYGAVEAHSMGDLGQCRASNKTIASETGLKESSVATIMSVLNKAGWVKVYVNEKNQRTGVDPLMVIKPPFNTHLTPLQSPLNIYNSNKNTVKNNTSVSPPDLQALGEANTPPPTPSPHEPTKTTKDTYENIFIQLVERLHPDKQILYTDGRRSKIAARLKRFVADDILLAAENLTKSEWHMGVNPSSTKYASFDFLMRNDEQVEKWRDQTPQTKKKSVF